MTNIRKPDYKFCPKCGHALKKKIINKKKELACNSCGFIFWIYPMPSVTAIIIYNDKILLIKRGTGTTITKGSWVMPGGYIEYGEDPVDSVKRELKEEINFKFQGLALNLFAARHDTFDPSGTGVEIFYEVKCLGKPTFSRSEEAIDAKWFSFSSLPNIINPIHSSVINDYMRR